MTVITTIRHAATDFGREKRIAGRLDVGLSTAGEGQAAALKSYVDDLGYDVVLSSRLTRALRTARLCTGLSNGRVLVRDDCVERSYGLMQGLDPEQVKQRYPGVRYVRAGAHDHSIDPPGGETLADLRRRAERFRTSVLASYPGRSILIFSHYTFLQLFHGQLLESSLLDSLKRDVAYLEVNRFVLGADGRVEDHRTERPVEVVHEAW